MKNHINKTRTVFTCIFLLATLWASNAMAADGKLYPGLMCNDRYSSTAPLDHTIRYRSDGGISNKTEYRDGTRVYCVVTRDSHQSVGAGISKVHVYYTNNNSTAAFSCVITAQTMGDTGQPVHVASETSGVGIRSGAFTIDEFLPAQSQSFYYLVCRIPLKTANGESTLHAYYVEEK